MSRCVLQSAGDPDGREPLHGGGGRVVGGLHIRRAARATHPLPGAESCATGVLQIKPKIILINPFFATSYQSGYLCAIEEFLHDEDSWKLLFHFDKVIGKAIIN